MKRTATSSGQKPRGWRRVLWVGVMVSILAAGGLLVFGASDTSTTTLKHDRPSDSPRAVTTETVSTKVVEPRLSLTGSLVAREEITVSTSVEGQSIHEVLVEEGDEVEKGQVLIRLETDLLDHQLRRATAAVSQARAALEHQKAIFSDAEAKFRRAEQLRQNKVVSDDEYGQRQANFLAEGHSLQAAEADLAQAVASESEARIMRERAVIRAPADGIISGRSAQTGNLVGTEPLLSLIRDGEIEFEAEVAESDLPSITAGQAVEVKAAGIQPPIKGRVRSVLPKIDPQTRLGLIRVSLPDHPGIKVGAFASGEVALDKREILAIGSASVSFETADRSAFVFVVTPDNRAMRRSVEIGERAGDNIEIRSGLDLGDQVVSVAGAFLQEGETIRPSLVSADAGDMP